MGHSDTLIMVSHSGRQYVHRFIQALLANKKKVIFCTPFWIQHMPGWLNWLPARLRNKLIAELKKRAFSFNGNIKVVQQPFAAVYKEVAERLPFIGNIEREQFRLEKRHDHNTTRQIKRYRPNLIIGYEISSAESFRLARSQRTITVLDLAQIHYEEIIQLANQFEPMHFVLENPQLKEINARKQKEYELADYIITLSSYARQTLIERGFSPEKVYEVHLGFDVKMFTAKSHYKKDRPLQLMICGTDMIRKGLGLLIQVIKLLQEQQYELQLTVIGPSVEVEKAIKKYGSVANMEIIQFLPHEELVKKYQQADLFVFPSYLDSWAMTVLEAMACGTPVIVTENTGSKDAVKKGGGIVIATGDSKALQEAIVTFYNDRFLLEETGKKAHQVAMEYSWENYYREIGEVFDDIYKKSGLINQENHFQVTNEN